MNGTLKNTPTGWVVVYKDSNKPYNITNVVKELPLHPNDVEQISKDSLIFDNIEARIEAYPDVDFIIERYCNSHKCDPQIGPCTLDCAWDEQKYAKIIHPEPQVSDDFQIGPDGAYEHEDTTEPNDWTKIFNHIEMVINVPLPIRLKNWLNNTFHPPIKRTPKK